MHVEVNEAVKQQKSAGIDFTRYERSRVRRLLMNRIAGNLGTGTHLSGHAGAKHISVCPRRQLAIELQRIRISSVYISFRDDGFCAQGLGTVPHSQTFHLRSRPLALLDIRHNDTMHISAAQQQPLDFR